MSALFIIIPSFVIGIALTFYLFWFFTFRCCPKNGTPALAYHHIDKHIGFPATKISARQFERQMHILKERNFRTLTPDFFLKQHQHGNGNGNGTGRKDVLITFDDSYQSVFDNALPVLKSLDYSALFFVITGYIGKHNHWDVGPAQTPHMSREQILKAIEQGFVPGSHTKTHPDLTALSGRRLMEELLDSKKAMEDLSGRPVHYLAYPFGRFNGKVKQAVQDAGYKAAFTINRPMFRHGFDRFAIPVTGIYSLDSDRNFVSKIERDAFVWIDDMRDKIINRFSGGPALVKGNRK